MKRSAGFIIFALLIVVTSSFAPGGTRKDVVDIKDVRQTSAPAPNPAKHKYHDIEVYRTKNGDAESYLVYFYRTDSDSLKCYRDELSMRSKPDMDKASYKWVNDTLATVRLYNSVTGKDIHLQVFGNGKRHGIGVDDKAAK